MYCPACGHQNTLATARFCMGCGQPMPSAAAGVATPPPPKPLVVEVEHGSAFSVARVQLQAGQSIRAESGAMIAMSAHIHVDAKMEGGMFRALKRALARESLFQTTFTAHGAPGEVLLAPSTPGEVVAIDLAGGRYILQASSFLACEPNLTLDTQLSGFTGFFGGEGLFFLSATGTGKLLVSSFGAIVRKTLAAGERYVVDSGHIVAFDAHVRHQLRKASRAGLWASFKSGEGVVVEYEGPGEILLQTRNLQALALELWPLLPKPTQGVNLLGGG